MADSVSAKVLQTGTRFGYLLWVGGQYIKVFGDSISHLQVLSRNTFENIETALSRSTLATKFSQQFMMKARVACHDSGSSNAPVERLLHQKRDKWASLQLKCDAHGCSNMVSGTMTKLLGPEVSGIIAIALVLRAGNNLQTFRVCLQEKVTSKLVILKDSPSTDAIEWRRKAMETFMSGQTFKLVDQVLICRLPNGDWRRKDRVEYYPPAGQDVPSQEAVAAMLCSGLNSSFGGQETISLCKAQMDKHRCFHR